MDNKAKIVFYGIRPKTEQEMENFISVTGEPEAVVLSSFDPIKREIANITIEN